MKRFEILEDGPARFVLVDNCSDEPAPVFKTRDEAKTERRRRIREGT
jgi:hypothetical protein